MITQNKTVSNVSYIQNETMKQKQKYETVRETSCETRKSTIDIKALAIRVLERSRQITNETQLEPTVGVSQTKLETRTKIYETEGSASKFKNNINPSQTSVKQKLNIEDLLYIFEERISIMVFDGRLSEAEAINKAFFEIIKNNFLNTL